MDEKFYDLLEKLYFEVQSVKSELKAELQEVKDTMATKAELQEIKDTMSTKEDLELAVEEVKAEIQSVHDEVKHLRQDLNNMEIIATKNSYDIARLKVLRDL